MAVLDRNDLVVLAPDRHRRQLGTDVQPVECADGLAAVVDDRPQRAQERVAGGPVRERRVGAPDLGGAR